MHAKLSWRQPPCEQGMHGCLPRAGCLLAVCCARCTLVQKPGLAAVSFPEVGPWKVLSPSLRCSWVCRLPALACLGKCGGAVGGHGPTSWDHLWHLPEGECDDAHPQVVPVLAVPRKSQPGFSVSAFVPVFHSR